MLAHAGFGGGGEDGFGQFGGVLQPAGSLTPQTDSSLGIPPPLPASTRTTALPDRFRRLTSMERPVTKGTSAAVTALSGDSPVRWLGTVRTVFTELFKPEQRHLRQQSTLARNRLAHDDVKRAQAVAGDHQNAVAAHSVVVANLAACEEIKELILEV